MRKGLLIAFLLITTSSAAWAQGCALCTKTAGELGNHSARGLNSGILYLAFIPITIMGALGIIWWRSNKNT